MPDFSLELAARARGVAGPIVGVDEVGRGPLAGPVFACAVWLFERPAPDESLTSLQDSKQLVKARREAAIEGIGRYAVAALGEASVAEIDELNILQASLLAMRRAVDALAAEVGAPPGLALIDGNRPPTLCCPAETVVKGDGLSLSIAAASIFAWILTSNRVTEHFAALILGVTDNIYLREGDARPPHGDARHATSWVWLGAQRRIWRNRAQGRVAKTRPDDSSP